MLRDLGLVVLLLSASAGVASAMDQSAIEETNCLQACDANQEHCATSAAALAPRNYSLAQLSSSARPKSSPVVRPHRTVKER